MESMSSGISSIGLENGHGVYESSELIDDLARRTQGGEAGALGQLYDHIWPQIRACLSRYCNGHPWIGEWDDLKQEAYVILADLVVRWRGEGPFQAWFWKAFPWKVKRYTRTFHSSVIMPPERLLEIADGLQARRNSGDGVDITDSIFCRQLLSSLPQDYRSVIHWRFYEGLTFAEIEQLYGVPATTAQGRCQRALVYLRYHLEGQKPSRSKRLFELNRCGRPKKVRHSDYQGQLTQVVTALWTLAEDGDLLPAAPIVRQSLSMSQRRYERFLRDLRELKCLTTARGVSFASRQGRRLRLACPLEEALARLASRGSE